MSEISTLRAHFELTCTVMNAAVADTTHAESLRTPVKDLNGMNWVLGHVTHVNAGILELLGAPGDPSSHSLRRYAPGMRPINDPADLLDFNTLRNALREQGPLLDSALSGATEELLASSPPEGFDGELRNFLHFIGFHQAYHAGQLGFLRRALGYSRAFG